MKNKKHYSIHWMALINLLSNFIYEKSHGWKRNQKSSLKHVLVTCSISLFMMSAASAQSGFITTWETTTASESITINTHGGAGPYNYNVDWGDGNTDTGLMGDATHIYATAGIHTVEINGVFPSFFFVVGGDNEKILTIEQWGNIAWSYLGFKFTDCINLTYNAIDAPNLDGLTSLAGVFSGATSFNGNISNWDVSNIQSFGSMFAGATSFNQDLGSWDVGSATNMVYMFSGATSYNQNLNSWNVSNVTNMTHMFSGATSFNQDMNSWDVSNVINMPSMFANASAYNQDLSSWDVSHVTSMSYMFVNASAYNQDLSNWNVSNVTNMLGLFQGATSFNQDLNSWNVSNVTNMSNMFANASAYNQDLSNWDVSNVTNMVGMFQNTDLSTTNYDAILGAWSQLSLQSNVPFGANGVSYCNSEAARNVLTNNFNWMISDAGKNCPTADDIVLTTTSIDENNVIDAVVGTLNTTGNGIMGNLYNYILTAGTGDSDNNSFHIVGTELRADESFDFESKNSYSIRVKTDDNNGDVLEKEFVITINDVTNLPQIITLQSIANKLTTDASFDMVASVDSGLELTYTVTGVAVNSGTTITLDGTAGTVTVTVEQAGDLDYAAVSEELIFDVDKADQVITFGVLVEVNVSDGGFDLTATASSGLLVTYESSDITVAEISGNTVTIVGVGTTTITASQDGDETYNEAADVSQVLTVNNQAQEITFESLADVTIGDVDFELTATASSGLPVSYSSSDESIVTISGSTVTIVGAGTASIIATQAGDSDYEAAELVEQSITVNKLSQSISFTVLADVTIGDVDFELTATASSGLPVSYSSSDESIVTISGSTVTIVGAGTASIIATQAGDGDYEAAEFVEQSITVNKLSQSITFTVLADVTMGDASFELFATASSGLSVTYTSSNASVATVSGSTVTIVGSGNTTIIASQVGNSNYSNATEIQQNLRVKKQSQTINFTTIEDQLIEAGKLTLTATASSGLDVSYEIVTGPATLSGNIITLTGIGKVELNALQAGNDSYIAADPVVQSFEVISVTGRTEFDQSQISTYPNPVINILHIDVNGKMIRRVQLLDINGKTIISVNSDEELDLSGLKVGQYILRISTVEEVITQKIIKQ